MLTDSSGDNFGHEYEEPSEGVPIRERQSETPSRGGFSESENWKIRLLGRPVFAAAARAVLIIVGWARMTFASVLVI